MVLWLMLFLVDVHRITWSSRSLGGFHGRDGNGFFGSGTGVRVGVGVGVLLVEDCSDLGCRVWIIKNGEK